MHSTLAKHPFGWRYIFLRIMAGLIRLVMLPERWRSRRLHEGVIFKIITVPSRDAGRDIKVHLYQPADRDSTKPAPVLVNWHGSGFIIPSLGENREFCSLVAARTKSVVFDADYRKSPEHPFPAAIQDAEDITRYLAANPDKYDLSNTFLSGFSAGGNIALVTASALGPERIKGVLTFYPVVDLTKLYTAPEKRFITGITISDWVYHVFYGAYVLPDQTRNEPRISVNLAPAESFPNHVYVVCGNADTLYDPARKLVERLKEAGHNDAEFVGLEYMGHMFDIHAKKDTEGEEKKVKVYTGAVDLINRAISATI